MKRHPLTTCLLPFVLMSMIGTALNCRAADSKDENKSEYSETGPVKFFEFSKRLKVRGFQLSDNVYMGQAKVAGRYGVGFVVDAKTYSWGINHHGIAILKRF